MTTSTTFSEGVSRTKLMSADILPSGRREHGCTSAAQVVYRSTRVEANANLGHRFSSHRIERRTGPGVTDARKASNFAANRSFFGLITDLEGDKVAD